MDNKLSELSKPVNIFIDGKPLYSQEYVFALLAELEAKDKRIAELEAIATDYAGKFQKAQDANKHLIIMSNDDKRRITELETKLATPVRLPELTGDEDLAECVFKYVAAIRAAGFTVEGDE